MKQTIIIGDLHGCLTEAEELLDKCQATINDRVILLGDLVDRGPDSVGCVNLAMKLETLQNEPACVLGNHETKHLYYHDIEQKFGHVNVTIETHVTTRLQLRAEHYEYMSRLPRYIRLPEHNAIVVHAGVYPGIPIEKQDPYHLMHLQMIDPVNHYGMTKWPSKIPVNEKNQWKFWTHLWDGPEKIIFGHTVFDKPLITEKVFGIDGGACFGMSLHALILPNWEIVSVKSNVNHGKGHHGRERNPLKTFKIHGDIETWS